MHEIFVTCVYLHHLFCWYGFRLGIQSHISDAVQGKRRQSIFHISFLSLWHIAGYRTGRQHNTSDTINVHSLSDLSNKLLNVGFKSTFTVYFYTKIFNAQKDMIDPFSSKLGLEGLSRLVETIITIILPAFKSRSRSVH